MSVNFYKSITLQKYSAFNGLKGQCILARPNGLGSKGTPNTFALKGQNKGRILLFQSVL